MHKIANFVTPINFDHKTKMVINAFSMGIRLAKCLIRNISQRRCEIERWFRIRRYGRMHAPKGTHIKVKAKAKAVGFKAKA